MKPKTPNHSTKKKPKKRGRSQINIAREKAGDYGPQNGFSEEKILALGKSVLEWALEEIDKPRSRRLSLRKYWCLQKIHPVTPSKCWYKRFPEFRRDCELANYIIGTMREEGMLLKELEPGRVAYNLHNYLPEYIKADKYHDEREIAKRKADAKTQEPVRFIIERE